MIQMIRTVRSRSAFTPLLACACRYSTNSPLPIPPHLPSLASDDDMNQARSWISAFNLIQPAALPRDALTVSYSRSSGPGGQNVNKLSTKATVRLSLSSATRWIPQYVFPHLRQSPYYTSTSSTTPTGVGQAGSILISASEHRTQPLNLSSALTKLHSTILSAARVGLVGTTSDSQRERVVMLERGEKRRTEAFKKGRKEVKGGRKFTGGGDY